MANIIYSKAASFALGKGAGSFPNMDVIQDTANSAHVNMPNNVPIRSDGLAFSHWTRGDSTGATSDYHIYCNQCCYIPHEAGTALNDAVFYANYEKKGSRAVLFDLNGGSRDYYSSGTLTYQGYPNMCVLSGTSVLMPKDCPTRAGYAFVGWSDSASTSPTEAANIASSGGYYIFSESKYPAGSVITMYAIWQKRNPIYVNIPRGKSLSGVYVNVPSDKTLKNIYVNR